MGRLRAPLIFFALWATTLYMKESCTMKHLILIASTIGAMSMEIVAAACGKPILVIPGIMLVMASPAAIIISHK